MASLKISYRAPGELKPQGRNPRTHTATQIRRIAASIGEFGFVNPVLIDGADGIIAGHARVEAAKLLGMNDIPTVRVDHLTPDQVRAYVIADNRLAELAGWDSKLLALELQELSIQPNFDVSVTGFDTAEVDILIGELGDQASDERIRFPKSNGKSRPYRNLAIYGGLETTRCSAATRWIRRVIGDSSAVSRQSWCLRTHPSTSLSGATSRGSEETDTANLQWPPAR
jgi:hypothetical protein